MNFKIPFVPNQYQDIALYAMLTIGGIVLTHQLTRKSKSTDKAPAVEEEDIQEGKEAMALAYQSNEPLSAFTDLNEAILDEYKFKFKVDTGSMKLIAVDQKGNKLKSYNLDEEMTEVLKVIN